MKKTLIFLDSYAPDFNVENALIRKTYKFVTDSYFNFLYNAKILPWLKSNADEKQIKLVALDIKTYERLKQKKINPLLLKYELSSEEEINQDKAINKEGVDYARSLVNFDPEFKRVQEYDGLSLLDLEIFFSYRYITRLLKKIKFLSSFIKEQKKLGFDEIAVFNGSINSLLLQIAAKNNAMQFSDKSPAITKASSFIKKAMLPFAAKMMIPVSLKKIKAVKLRSKEKHTKKILVLTDVLRTIKLTAPWAKLVGRKKFDLLVIGLNESDRNAYEKENVNYKVFKNYCTEDSIKNINKKKKQLSSYFSKFNKNPILRSKIKYDDCGFSEALFELFTYFFKAGFIEVVYYIEILKNIYEIEKPDLVIVFGDITKFARTVALTCRAREIKTLLLQHGGVEDVPIFGKELITDKIALFGSRYKDVYLKMGIEQKRLIVVGNMLYDDLAKKIKAFDKNKIFNELELDKNKKLIAYMSVPELNESEQEALMAPLIEGVKKLKNVQLVIKLHPTEQDIDVHRKIIEKYGIKAKIIKDFDTYALIWASDVIITTYSTVGSETAIMGKPLVTLNYFDKTYIANYSGEGIAIPAMKNDVAEAIEKALYDNNARKKLKITQKRFIKGSCYRLDGKAGERVKKLIENMISS
ncbi:MAG: UDP-N-acetylglucosamine 2-epimerase [Candidatus Woesearchaeota archaeon]|nr:UDP-N-acetylglucosamine 2-epimerase [Candidatus Woesearchaeota archaeon]